MDKGVFDRLKDNRDPEKFQLRLEKERLIAKIEDLTKLYVRECEILDVWLEDKMDKAVKENNNNLLYNSEFITITARQAAYIKIVRELKKIINT